jgi:pyruvate,orthophosphate dikinase
LIDPPLHEFLPNLVELMEELSDLKIRLQHAADLGADRRPARADPQKRAHSQTGGEPAGSQNPMLGLRGVRLGIHIPN